MLTVAVVNQKGGVAKTTTAVNLSVGLAAAGKRVLLVDLDPQGHSTIALRVDREKIPLEKTVYSLFYETPITDLLIDTIEPNLKLLPASIHLAIAIENSLQSVMFREGKLKKALPVVADHFDYAILDCNPTLGILPINAIIAADRILIPTTTSFYSLDGLDALLGTIAQAKPDRSANFDWRILITRVKGIAKLRQAAAWKILDPIQERILATQIREVESVEQSQMSEDESRAMVVVKERASRNKAAQDYQDLVKEVLEIWSA